MRITDDGKYIKSASGYTWEMLRDGPHAYARCLELEAETSRYPAVEASQGPMMQEVAVIKRQLEVDKRPAERIASAISEAGAMIAAAVERSRGEGEKP